MRFRFLVFIYLFALAVEIFANLGQNIQVEYFSKPALMPLLILYFAVNAKNAGGVIYAMLGALVFSWFGDVLLLADKQFKSLFIFGLIAFLAAHLCFIVYFLKIRKLNGAPKLPNKLGFVALAAYTISLLVVVVPNAPALAVPVAIYALALSTMVATSLAAFDFNEKTYWKLCLAGTFLFMVSDSILAVNRFVAPVALAPLFIMLTYGLAQLLIVEGSLRNLKDLQ
ncbi:MAG: lysoplasmalogenase [Acidobacteria bacterium]|nr:lysoplasmalogenase [Acidobacteriota bacterium]